jgi:coatomer subunit beta'
METTKKQQEVSTVFQMNSERVKMVDLHPKEPLVLCSLYTGQVQLWNYETSTLLKTFEIVDLPVRCVKFITRLQSFVCGSDDMCVRVYNYNTMERTKTFEAHQDYIRGLAVHDSMPLLLTSSDDMTIKLWDWSKGWVNTMTFEGHSHYVMSVVFNPKDPSTFATASLDHLIMCWSILSPVRNFQLEGHEKGVNCVEYCPTGDKPYLISGSDDYSVRVWDYQTKACIQTLTHHVHFVSSVMFHPDLPLVLTGSEDETVDMFSTLTWRQETTKNYGRERIWSMSTKPKMNRVAIGFDTGMVVLKIGQEEPVMSMDANGKIFFAQTNEISRLDIKAALEKDVADGEHIMLPSKEVGTAEGVLTKILHGPNGQYVAVLTQDDYTINSALAWRPKAFGPAIAFVWGNENGAFAILENAYTLKTYKNFKAAQTIRLAKAATGLYGGPVIGVAADGAVCFYDWEELRNVRMITEAPKDVVWSDSNELVAVVTETSAFVLKFNAGEVEEAFEAGAEIPEDGIDTAFDLVEEVEEKMRRALWVGDCLVFVNNNDRLMYYIGGEMTTLAVMQRAFHLLGYVAKENRLYCMDRERNVVAYQLYTAVIEYKTAIVREDFDAAAAVLPKVPEAMRGKVAEFLQARELLELAMEVTVDEDQRFELAVLLNNLAVALDIAKAKPQASRWKQVGDIALEQCHFDVAEHALTEANDLNGLLLLHTCTGNTDAISALGKRAAQQGRSNMVFTCCQILGEHDECIDLLAETNRVPEAAFYARTHRPHRITEIVDKWKRQLVGMPRLRDCVADPVAYPNLFPNVNLDAAAEEAEAEAADEDEEVAVATHVDPAAEASASPPTPPQSPALSSPPKQPEASSLEQSPQLTADNEDPATPSSPPASPQGLQESPAAADDDDMWGDDALVADAPADDAAAPAAAAGSPQGGIPQDDIDALFS